ncbi:hypothetical protein BXZ70DRAFT_888328, partial [Cristinia sonorae]
ATLDTCRICSAPAEPDQPLFYPCKCSGTIRYIHQDCLTTWLAHSKKKTCDVCKYPYSFTKVYSKDMPSRLPVFLLVRRLAQQALMAVLFVLRAILVGMIWLAFLPWATIMTWRMYFAMGESTAWWISSYPRSDGSQTQRHTLVLPNATATVPQTNHTTSHNETLTIIQLLATHPTVRNLSADILSGQIIASVIVLGFVAVFLLREWISQNARPGVFDDADAPPEGDLPPPLLDEQPPQEPAPAPAPAPEPPVAIPVIVEEPMLHPPMNGNGIAGDTRDGERRKIRRIEARGNQGLRTKKGKEPIHANGKLSPGTPKRRRSWDGPSSSRSSPVASSSGLALNVEQAQFTFTAPVPTSDVSAEAIQPSREIPSPSQSPLPTPLRRPPLPAFTLPSSPSPKGIRSRAHTPLASPSLATYQPPEELEAGPSNLTGYFQNSPPRSSDADSDDTLFEEVKDEHHHYFREPILETTTLYTTDQSDQEDEMDDDEDDEDAVVPFGGVIEEEELPLQIRIGQPGDEAPARPDQLQALAPGRAEQDAMDQEEIDAAMEDDMDGALEAIGLRGPLYGVLQNAGLMIFVLDITIAVLVWFPFTMGKSLALLALNPRRSMQLLHLPLRAIRFITDPIVDFVVYMISRTLVPPFLRLCESVVTLIFSILATLMGDNMAAKVYNLSVDMVSHNIPVGQHEVDDGQSNRGMQATTAAVEAGPTLLERMAAEDSLFFRLAEPYFAPIGHSVRTHSVDAKETWIRLAISNGTSSKIFAITLGYTVDAILLALYLNVLTVGSVRSAGRAVRSAVRQQLLVLKVAGFIIVELVVFPLGCGVMLDICTVWLFPQGSFRSRAAFLMFAPLTSAFYHWVLGTMFMYQFAVLLAGCRSIMRSGAMWFIKDPQDQNFHPIRDILERPTFVQIRKLLLSALMYGLVVLCGVATVSGLLRVFSKTIMPFRWKIREPLSEVPIDLIFLHTALPYTLHYFRPKKFVHKVGSLLWRYLSRQLRLTSYMFGERRASEEITVTNWSWRQLFAESGVEMDDAEAHHDGTFRRVPNSDNVSLVKHEPATIEVDVEGQPKTENDRRLMELQNAEAEKNKRNVKDDYIIVYIPPHFRYRVIAFIFCMWVVGSTGLSLALAGPIIIGRSFFKLFVTHEVHDGYAFLAGFYLLWGCWIAGTTIDRMERRRQRRGNSEDRAYFPLFLAKRTLLWTAKASYMAFFLAFVIPTLVALVMELYIILPARMSMNAEVEPRIRIVDMWALGLLYTKIAMRANRIQADGQIARGIEHIRRTGWLHPDPLKATKDVIAPLTGGLLGMIIVPPLLLFGVRRFFPVNVDDNFLFLHVYPTIFTAAGCAHGITALSSLIGTWSQSVRDKEFLVEMRLQNLEQEAEKREQERREAAERERSVSPLEIVDADVDDDVDDDD